MTKNIIFDMGNVIIDIDVPATYRAFADLAGISEEEATAIFHEKNFYYNLEVGKTDNQTFRNQIRASFGDKLTDHAIDEAWCALLKEMPKRAPRQDFGTWKIVQHFFIEQHQLHSHQRRFRKSSSYGTRFFKPVPNPVLLL